MTQSEPGIIRAIELDEATIILKTNGVVYVYYKDGVILDVELQLKMVDCFHDITEKKLTPFIFTAGEGVTVTKEARDNAILIEEQSPCAAMAIVASNLAYKIIANFYMQFNKPKRPYKVFSNIEDATNWAKTFID